MRQTSLSFSLCVDFYWQTALLIWHGNLHEILVKFFTLVNVHYNYQGTGLRLQW
jgi:hypothetical protein